MVEILALVLHREEQPRTRPDGTRALIRHRLQTTLLDVLGGCSSRHCRRRSMRRGR